MPVALLLKAASSKVAAVKIMVYQTPLIEHTTTRSRVVNLLRSLSRDQVIYDTTWRSRIPIPSGYKSAVMVALEYRLQSSSDASFMACVARAVDQMEVCDYS